MPERTLACYLPPRLITEHGEVIDVDCWERLREEACRRDLLVLTPPLSGPVTLGQIVADKGSTVFLNRDGSAVACVALQDDRDGRRVRYAVPWSSWFEGTVPEPAQLATLRLALDTLGVGVRTTPSSAGLAKLRQVWPGKREEPMLSRPAVWLWQIFKENLVGGRVDTIAPGIEFRIAWGEDMRGAYVAASRQVPGGTACVFQGTPPAACVTYYQELEVDVPEVALGPLPLRLVDRVEYPVGRRIKGWFWAEEEHQLPVRVLWRGRGYAYPRWCTGFAPWAETMFTLREGLSDHNELTHYEAASILKRASVATVGLLAAGWESLSLSAWEGEGERWCSFELGPETPPARLVRARKEREVMMIQAASYINMAVRCALHRRALPYAAHDTLIATNYDELLTIARPGTIQKRPGLGEWKVTEYRNLIVPYPRAKRAEGVDVRPGLAKRLREA